MATKKITQRVLLIPSREVEGSKIEKFKTLSLEEKKKLATDDLSFEEFVDYVNHHEMWNIYCEWYDETPDYFFAQLGEHDDSIELVLNDFAEFHIKRKDGAYSADVYKYHNQKPDYDYDFNFDDAFAFGYVFDDDIEDLSCDDEDEEDDEEE